MLNISLIYINKIMKINTSTKIFGQPLTAVHE